ncbi:cilia- and flagella-associated protein 141-like isoform X2 [Ruditapes philippinarum]|uniref:cilia- and flagella-associated protein 141-like isoform X2 n=1 Tax=Ruditapes philippinarum TaxID=129788 RepID=UPI00295AD6E7|nr:cilia- and flagella-associated protein 141-like isoform X2 [Ruditapes philippinarum]
MMTGKQPSYIEPPWDRGFVTYDEVMADRENVVRLEKNVNQRATWNEKLEESSWGKRIRSEADVIKAEMRMAAKAALSVRRVALKQLLEKEYEIWEKELSLKGKTFYKQRI